MEHYKYRVPSRTNLNRNFVVEFCLTMDDVDSNARIQRSGDVGNNSASYDDFFGSQDDDVQHDYERRSREWEALRRLHFNAGLREGGSAAHDANLQQGFDEGFAAGARTVAESAFLYVVRQ